MDDQARALGEYQNFLTEEKSPRAELPATGVASSVNDLDHLARPRLHDHPAIADNRIAIFGVARDRAQLNG
jgi:hypothetical protein